jgi:hypothetical protein
MVAAGSAGRPERCLLAGAGGVASGGQRVEATAGEAELIGGLCGVEGVQAEAFKHMTDERGRVPMNELLVLFKDAQTTRRSARTRRQFARGASSPHRGSAALGSLRSPSLRLPPVGGGRGC